ncbi:antibiotic biosynthesis monooxygenase [Patiriisocius marinistellae]|uniref:Antibiotic biosynthesis monooxygenase n=1 Tax=Patiriisocius marinistellae TaxID=2494560 RepID=A0A5J4FSG2_9FLAO|nr:antibiotic biosynthesis monooxygenase [Patiriisocius marinistellae]GEQ84977.1 antibiotic biosynthesis monooxygenase [Patiriisocius marinistellae]
MTNNYYAVIFTSTLSKHTEGYNEMAHKMELLAEQQNGFLGISSARENIGITISYWENEQAIINWKANLDHQLAQKFGKLKWYSSYKVEVALIKRSYNFNNKNLP